MCPTCRTVQDWTGDRIFQARIFCRGDDLVGRHEPKIVTPVGVEVSR
jgi:hypothetical protein